jgi:hypothetical protein
MQPETYDTFPFPSNAFPHRGVADMKGGVIAALHALAAVTSVMKQPPGGANFAVVTPKSSLVKPGFIR